MNTNYELHIFIDFAAHELWREFWPDLVMPDIVITFVRKQNALGYFNKAKLANRDASRTAHEIAINPQYVLERTAEETVSTLAHEIVHLWQQVYGDPGRGGYHNRQWADEMKRVGLQPDNFKGGETGDALTHHVVMGGIFAEWYKRQMIDDRAKVLLGDQPHKPEPQNGPESPKIGPVSPVGKGGGTKAPKKDKSKVKFTCPSCNQNAWAKESALLLCGACSDQDYLVEMKSGA